MPKIDINQFVVDMCDVIGGMGVWPSFVAKMEEIGYSEEQIDEAFAALAERR